MGSAAFALGFAAFAFLLAAAGPLGAGDCSCPGDCDADCAVSDNDFASVLSSIFNFQLCAAADANRDGRISAADVVLANAARVDPALGCRPTVATATPTSSSTATPTSSVTPSASRTTTATATLTTRPTSTRTPTTVPTPASRWIPLAPLPGGGRQEVGVAHLDGIIYVIGGLSPGATDRVDAYNTAGDAWTDVAPLPIATHHVGAAALDGFVYAIGGLRPPGFTPTDEVYRYDPTENRWQAVAPLPRPRGAMAVAVADGRIHAIGGDATGRQLGVRDHAAYIPEENRWVVMTDFPLAREHIAAAGVNNTIYVVGGRSPLDRNAHQWDSAAEIWIPLPQMNVARAGHAATDLGSRLVVFGGEGTSSNANAQGVFPQVEIYDPDTNRWTQIDDMDSPRHGIGAVTVGDRIYVPGGADRIAFGPVDTHDALEID